MTPPTGPSKPKMPPMPKQTPESKALFDSVVPSDHPAVTVRPMFGNAAAFVNGNMFMGLFGEDLFLRLDDADRSDVEAKGGGPFEPMPGRAMGGYVVIPAGWRTKPALVREWASRSLEFAAKLPPKEPKPKPAKKRS